MNKKLGLVIILTALLTLVGCKNKPVYNVEKAPITKSHNLEELSKAIKRAGASLGWRMKDEVPGEIVGILNLRKHMAKIKIIYNTENYSINYLDSSELNYDGGSIHSNYNGWIQNLDKNIQAQIDFL